MELTLTQKDAIVDALFDTVPGMNAVSGMAFLMRLEEILDFTPENATQQEVYSRALEYRYVLESFYQNKRSGKAGAIKFLRQVTSPTPELYNTRKVVDHFWPKFDKAAQ